MPDFDRLADAYVSLRQYDNAEYIYRRALVIRESVYGKVHADLIATIDGLAYACFGQQKYDEAEPLYRRLIDLWVFSVGNNHPMVAIALDKVAVFYNEQKKYNQAQEALDRANAIRARSLATGLEVGANWQWEQGKAGPTKTLLDRALRPSSRPTRIRRSPQRDRGDAVWPAQRARQTRPRQGRAPQKMTRGAGCQAC